jgi:endonuclease YncB( thermonuclease family)
MRRAAVVVLLVLGSVDAVWSQRGTSVTGRRDLVGRQIDARVVRVADGDTIEAIPAGEQRPIRIRLHGIDAPESDEVFSREAIALLRTLLFDRRVHVAGRDLDRYGRLVARITVAGEDASAALVRAGLACHAYARDPALARGESQARASGAGFWARTAKKPQCVERTAFSAHERQTNAASPNQESTTGRSNQPRSGPATVHFRGNVSSGLYHASTCPNANCRNCSRLFQSEAEARLAGFRPAGDCLREQAAGSPSRPRK